MAASELPERAAMMLVFAHPDDEGGYSGGAIPYYAVVRKLPVVVVMLTRCAWVENRHLEMNAAMRRYGLPYDAVFADFPDCGYDYPRNVDYVWRRWAGVRHEDALEPPNKETRIEAAARGREAAIGFVTQQIRRFKPAVILTHDFDGEYGHPNHCAVAQATAAAFERAADRNACADQLAGPDALEPWQTSKLYIHLWDKAPHWHDWDMDCPELEGMAPSGRRPVDVANWALECHASQGEQLVEIGETDTSSHDDARRWGLYASTVGPDRIARNDFFENIDVSVFPTAPPPSETRSEDAG